MDVYATMADLEAGWKPLYGEVDESVANTLLERASAFLNALLTNKGISINPDDEVQMTNLKTVTCSIVRRSLTDMDTSNIASIAQSVGSTNVSISYRAQDGSFYLSEADKLLLGIKGKGKMRTLRTAIHNQDGTLVEGW